MRASPTRQGTIVGGSVYVNSISVLFDGNKSPATIHREYVEVLLPSLGRAKQSGKPAMKARTRVCFPSGRGDVEPERPALCFGERCRSLN